MLRLPYLRPLVVPAVPGFTHEKRLETRFAVPGGLVANLGFRREHFRQRRRSLPAGERSALDPDGWTGHTGCVISWRRTSRMPLKHLLGLPHWDAGDATSAPRRDVGEETENQPQCCRHSSDHAPAMRKVMVTIIADNYFGYCKKEVKTQISFSANLFGSAEEEHAGGALVFPSYSLGATNTRTPARAANTS